MTAEPDTVFVGVDAGATKTHVVALDTQGAVIGEARGAAASLGRGAAPAWAVISAALDTIALQAGGDRRHAHVVIGIAGTEITQAYQDFLAGAPAFASLVVCSDARVACAGAHALADGAIVSVGTGVVGFCRYDGQSVRAGGWGFPHDDRGSGAWLGMEAVAHALAASDGRARRDGFAERVMADFEDDPAALSAWACQAASGDFARYARVCVEQAAAGNAPAQALLAGAGEHVAAVAWALIGSRSDLALALTGGLALVISDYLPAELRARLVEPAYGAAHGAALMARKAHDTPMDHVS